MWSRVKRFLRSQRVCKPTGGDYGLMFSEFLRRLRYCRGSEWPKKAMGAVVSLLATSHGAELQKSIYDAAALARAGENAEEGGESSSAIE